MNLHCYFYYDFDHSYCRRIPDSRCLNFFACWIIQNSLHKLRTWVWVKPKFILNGMKQWKYFISIEVFALFVYKLFKAIIHLALNTFTCWKRRTTNSHFGFCLLLRCYYQTAYSFESSCENCINEFLLFEKRKLHVFGFLERKNQAMQRKYKWLRRVFYLS